MVKISATEIGHIAKLANLDIKNSEEKKLGNQLSKVVSYFDELSEVAVSDIEPTSQTTNLVNNFREDKILENDSLSQEDALSGSENSVNGYFKVPGILDKEV